MYQNLHMHTYRCHHAGGTEREYIEHAIASGFEDIGFSDHTPQVDALMTVDPIKRVRMSMDELDGYSRTIHALSDEYKDRIKIRTGLELEYAPDHHGSLLPLLRNAGIEYFLMGEHFIDNGEYMTHKRTCSEYHLERYVDLVLEGAATGDFIGIAHPDVIGYKGPDSIYEKNMRRLAEGLKDLDMPVEINLYGLLNRRNYPDPRFWRIVSETGNRVFLSADAHQPRQVYDESIYLEAKQMASDLGLNLVNRILD